MRLFRVFLPALLLVGSSSIARAQARVEYDRFRDVTEVVATIPQGEKAGPFAVMAGYLCQGDRLCVPESIQLYFVAFPESWEYLDRHDINFLIDSEHRFLMETDHDGKVESGYVVETMIGLVSPKQFELIANGSTVEFQIGLTEEKLTDAQRKGLRELNLKIEEAR